MLKEKAVYIMSREGSRSVYTQIGTAFDDCDGGTHIHISNLVSCELFVHSRLENSADADYEVRASPKDRVPAPEVRVAKPVTARVEKRRDAMRKAGLRPVQIWVPDTRRPGFAEECRRQCRLAAQADVKDTATQQFLDEALVDVDGWKP